LIVCINTWTSDYATSACVRAEEDKTKFDDAKELCGDISSDCYKRATVGLTSQDECEARTEFMKKQMLMGIIPAIVGALLGIGGFFMAIGGFFLGRKKAAAT
jgi:hypothetical protein